MDGGTQPPLLLLVLLPLGPLLIQPALGLLVQVVRRRIVGDGDVAHFLRSFPTLGFLMGGGVDTLSACRAAVSPCTVRGSGPGSISWASALVSRDSQKLRARFTGGPA